MASEKNERLARDFLGRGAFSHNDLADVFESVERARDARIAELERMKLNKIINRFVSQGLDSVRLIHDPPSIAVAHFGGPEYAIQGHGNTLEDAIRDASRKLAKRHRRRK